MINVTDTIIQAYEKSTTQYDKIVLDNVEYVINNVDFDDDCYEEGNVFGTAIAKLLRFEIDSSVNLEGKEFKYYTGIKTISGIEWIKIGTFITQDVEPNDTIKVNTINAMDYMLKTNVQYVSNLEYSNNITLLQVAQEACNKAGIILATIDFPNKNFIVDSNQFEQGTLIRQVIQAIAQISGTVAKIKNDDKLYLVTPKTTGQIKKVFKLNDYSEIEIKRTTHPINLVSLGMSDVEGENIVLKDEASIQQYGENSLIINDNPFAYTQSKRQQLITAIFNAVKGFEYKAYTMTAQSLPYLETLDNIQIEDFEGNIYNSFIFRLNNKSPNGLESTIEAPSIIRATINYQNIPSALEIAKRTEFVVNKQKQQINALITSNESLVNKTTQLVLDVNEIKGQISEIADVTQSADGYGSVSIANINESEPIRVVVRPVTEDIAYLYASNNLYAANDLYLKNRKIRFATENYSIDWEIPANLLYYDSENYDELILDYESQTCVVNKKVGYNADGTKYLLAIPTTNSYPYPNIPLEEGDYTITVLGYPNAYLFVRLMVKNLYTTQFATKAEVKSTVSQTSQQIKSEVDAKFTNYSTTVQMNSAIDLKVGEINIELDKKVNNEDFTKASIILKLNDTSSQAKINADVIDLNANKILNLLAGNEINLTSNNIGINSTNFIVSKNGSVEIKGTDSISNFKITGTNSAGENLKLEANPAKLNFLYNNIATVILNSIIPIVTLTNSDNSSEKTVITYDMIQVRNILKTTTITPEEITTPLLTQTSLKSKKKNIKKTKINALELIKNADICEYNLKGDKPKSKKHIGLVIGEGYKCPKEVISEDGQGIEAYSQRSISWKAIQELLERVERLEAK